TILLEVFSFSLHRHVNDFEQILQQFEVLHLSKKGVGSTSLSIVLVPSAIKQTLGINQLRKPVHATVNWMALHAANITKDRFTWRGANVPLFHREIILQQQATNALHSRHRLLLAAAIGYSLRG